ncbi:MAG TPA: S8 family serine peptidase [Vicinamibacterales bacterium]|nr:S8 family serine peptidase [Vicinamibacterales bacterium]
MSSRRIALALSVAAAALTGWQSHPEAQGQSAPQRPGQRRYLVEVSRPGPEVPAAVRAVGGEVVHEFPQYRALAAWLPEAALAGLRAHPQVTSIELDPERFPLAETIPYGITMVQADLVSDAGAANRRVCIIDSGYSLGQPDLPAGGNVTGVDGGPAGEWSVDRCGHGSHVAGTIAALGQNGLGVLGVLPSGVVSLHIVKVFGDSCGWAYSSDLVAALNQCRSAGANVVNMSLGGPIYSTVEGNAFDDAYNAGVLSIAAAGNSGNTSTSYPAGYGSVVSVAAVDENKALATFSQRNPDVELAGPGVGVLSTIPWLEENSVTVDNGTYNGTWLEFAARTGSGGVSGTLADGGLCDSVGSWSGQVVLCQRGNIYFADKVANVHAGGGAAAVIYNNVPGGFVGTLLSPSQIPAIGISQEDGQILVAKNGLQSIVVSYRDETGGGYEAWNGTSMATPHVAGVAALIWSHYPGKTNADVRNALTASAEDLGVPGRDTSFGYGLVRAQAALDILSGLEPPPPPPPPVNIVLSATRRGKKVDLAWTVTASSSVDIYRNGSLRVSTANDGAYSDSFTSKGSYTYQVCEAGTANCSNEVTVVF